MRLDAIGGLEWSRSFTVGAHGSTLGWGLHALGDRVIVSYAPRVIDIRALSASDGEVLWERNLGCSDTVLYAPAEPSPSSEEVCLIARAKSKLDFGGDAAITLPGEEEQLVFGCLAP